MSLRCNLIALPLNFTEETKTPQSCSVLAKEDYYYLF